VGFPEGGDVVAGDGFDAIGGADGAEAVGVVSVESAEAYAEHGGYGLVAFLEDGDEALLADALDFFGGEGWVLDDVGEEVEAGFGVVAEGAETGCGLVDGGGGGQVGADLFGVVCEDGGGTLRGAFGEETRGEACEASFGGGVVFAAAADDDAGGEDGQGVVFKEEDLKAVGEREGFGDGKVEGYGGARGGSGLAPILLLLEVGGVGLGELGVGVCVVGAAWDVVDYFFAGDAVDDDALIGAEVLAGDLLDGGDGGGLVAGDVLGQIAGVVEELVVAVEGVGDTAEAAETLEADDFSGDVDGAGAVELGLGGAVGLKAGYFFPESGFEGFEGDVGFGGDVTLGDGA
jgi:hypothetical protein